MKFRQVDQVRVTTLVENSVNLFLTKGDNVERRRPDNGDFLAEHGWAALIETIREGEKHTILLDAGLSKTTLIHNMSILKIDPAAIEAIVISHGHNDHTGAVAQVIRHSGKSMPIHLHPAAFRERWAIPSDGPRRGPFGMDHKEWKPAGGQLVTDKDPREIFPGCITTGGIPRATDFEHTPQEYYYRENNAFHPDTILDDQSVVIMIKDKGLFIVSGCAHAGIVNTVRYARQITGEDRVWAVAGGFHLGRASQPVIQATIAGLRAVEPAIVAPGHCTGFNAIRAFAEAMPDQFILNVVGTTIHTGGFEA